MRHTWGKSWRVAAADGPVITFRCRASMNSSSPSRLILWRLPPDRARPAWVVPELDDMGVTGRAAAPPDQPPRFGREHVLIVAETVHQLRIVA